MDPQITGHRNLLGQVEFAQEAIAKEKELRVGGGNAFDDVGDIADSRELCRLRLQNAVVCLCGPKCCIHFCSPSMLRFLLNNNLLDRDDRSKQKVREEGGRQNNGSHEKWETRF
jgi:hypothetical protein